MRISTTRLALCCQSAGRHTGGANNGPRDQLGRTQWEGGDPAWRHLAKQYLRFRDHQTTRIRVKWSKKIAKGVVLRVERLGSRGL